MGAAVLEKLRKRLGVSGGQVSSDVLHHEGVDTGSSAASESAHGYQQQGEAKYQEKYEAPKYEAPKYEAPKYEAPKYEAPATEAPKYQEPPKYSETPKVEEPTTKYEAPKYAEPPKYYEGSQPKSDDGPKHVPHESAEEPDSFKDTII